MHQRSERTEYLDIDHGRHQMELTKSNSSSSKSKPTVHNEDTGKDDKYNTFSLFTTTIATAHDAFTVMCDAIPVIFPVNLKFKFPIGSRRNPLKPYNQVECVKVVSVWTKRSTTVKICIVTTNGDREKQGQTNPCHLRARKHHHVYLT